MNTIANYFSPVSASRPKKEQSSEQQQQQEQQPGNTCSADVSKKLDFSSAAADDHVETGEDVDPSSPSPVRPAKRLKTTSSVSASNKRRIVESDDEYSATSEVSSQDDYSDDGDSDIMDQDSENEEMEGIVSDKTEFNMDKEFSSFKVDSPKIKGKSKHSTKLSAKTSLDQEPGTISAKNGYEWLINVKDLSMHSPDHPDYDPKTLYIPSKALDAMTPGQRQYWEIKQTNFDVLLFFKMGKFYELFDMDAEIGNKELDLAFMRGDRAHVGFPESSFNKYAEKLVRLGYKVGRVEQVETPQQMKERNAKLPSKKRSKVVEREMISLLSKGTLIDEELIGKDDSSYLLSFTEHSSCSNDQSDSPITYGICLADTSTGLFRLGQFVDTIGRDRFKTLLIQLSPEEVVYSKDIISETSVRIIQNMHSNVIANELKAGSEFWNAQTTKEEVGNYFETDKMPVFVQELFSSTHNELTVSALGGCISYLRRMMLDEELLKISQFQTYSPVQSSCPDYMLLDGNSLTNLDILENENGSIFGTLLGYIDHCHTSIGKRKLKEWIYKPLYKIDEIQGRLQVIDELIEHSELVQLSRKDLKKIPDFDRLLSRIHSFGIVGKESKAIMYENINLKKFNIFLNVLLGYEHAFKVISRFNSDEFQFHSKELIRITRIGENEQGGFPNLMGIVNTFKESFDLQKAKNTGFILPYQGVDEEYDAICNELLEIEQSLQGELREIQSIFKDKSIQYVHKNKERYQVEISESSIKQNSHLMDNNDEYEHVSQRKGYSRFWTSNIKKMTQSLEEIEKRKEDFLNSFSRKFYAKFCEHYSLWRQASKCIAELDCYLNLVIVSTNSEGVMSRPEFIECSVDEQPFLELKGARHPCLSSTSSYQFIPNDTCLGTASNPSLFSLVTGPNMGGKSTLLRQTCLNVILAQIGCYVPADSCRLTPVDRIFTRVGAQDRILSGQSTFFVELEETCTILKHATKHSLVILDELGRGTSTFDGTSIAYAVSDYIINQLKCRTLFSTHYHVLTDEFKQHPKVSMYHMAFNIDQETDRVQFLYKYLPGVCSKSFGMNVASMAGIPEQIVSRARNISQSFEVSMNSKSHGSEYAELLEAVKKAFKEKEKDKLFELQQQIRQLIL